MTFTSRISKLALVGIVALAFTGCATHYDRKSSNTMMGAGLGAATGAVVSQGNPWMTLGGAAAGGVLGNILTEDRDHRRSRGWNRNGGRSHHHARGHDHRRHDDRRSRRHR